MHIEIHFYECNFWHDYTIYMCTYDNLQQFDPKYNQRTKNGKKGPKYYKQVKKQ